MTHFDQSELTVLRESQEVEEDDASDSSEIDIMSSNRKATKMSSLIIKN